MISKGDRSMIKKGLSEELNDGSSLHDDCRRTFSVGHQVALFGSQFLRDTDQILAGIYKPSIMDHIGLFRCSIHLSEAASAASDVFPKATRMSSSLVFTCSLALSCWYFGKTGFFSNPLTHASLPSTPSPCTYCFPRVRRAA